MSDETPPDDVLERLVGTWHTESVAGEPVPEGVVSSVAFTVEGKVQGHGGVNRFGGPYRVVGATVELGPFFSTRMAGPEPAMAHEAALLSALDGTRPFTVTSEVLVVGDGADEIMLRRLPEEAALDEAGAA